ncbi:hypothetical protein Tco_1201778 [Tanacetum coccineum]
MGGGGGEEFADELAHIAPIPPGIVEADLDDDTSSDDDDFEDVEYVSLEEVNEEKEFDLEDIFQIQDVILREKLLNISTRIDNFNELNDDQRGSEIDFSEDDDSFTFVIRTFLPFLTYPEVSLLSCSTGSEDTIFDPGIST